MFSPKEVYSVDEVKSGLVDAQKDNVTHVASISELEYDIDPEGQLLVTLPNGDQYTASENGVIALCKETGIPYGYYSKIDLDLKLRNLRTRSQGIARERKLRVNDDSKIFRGCVATSQTDFEHNALFDFLPKDGVSIVPISSYDDEAIVTEKYLGWRVLLEELPGGMDLSLNYLGLTVRTSELGGFYYNFPSLWRKVCGNGLIVSESLRSEHFRLSYGKLDPTLVKGLLDSLVSTWKVRIPQFKSMISDAEKTELSFEQAIQVIENLEKFKVTRKFINDMAEALPAKEISQWDLTNLVTRECQDLPEEMRYLTENAVSQILGYSKLFVN
jgi:hypothetical protein